MRAIVLALADFGVGPSLQTRATDAEQYDTFNQVYLAAQESQQTLNIPNLLQLGLGFAALSSNAIRLPNLDYNLNPIAKYGYAACETTVNDDWLTFTELPINQKLSSKKHWDFTNKTVDQAFASILNELPSLDKPSLLTANFSMFQTSSIDKLITALNDFDSHLLKLFELLSENDLLIIGAKNLRQHTAILAYHPNIKPEFIGRRDSITDIQQTIADFFGFDILFPGISFL